MRLGALVSAAGAVLATATPGYPWVNDGHRIVCEIALMRLTPAGKDLLDEAMALGTSIQDPFELHVGHAQDLGGNNLKVIWRPGRGQALNTNLHKVCDGEILRRAGLANAGASASLNGEITSEEVAQWETFDLAKWTADIHDLAHESAYLHANNAPIEMNGHPRQGAFRDGGTDRAHPTEDGWSTARVPH